MIPLPPARTNVTPLAVPPQAILNSLRVEIKEGRLEGPEPTLQQLQSKAKTTSRRVCALAALLSPARLLHGGSLAASCRAVPPPAVACCSAAASCRSRAMPRPCRAAAVRCCGRAVPCCALAPPNVPPCSGLEPTQEATSRSLESVADLAEFVAEHQLDLSKETVRPVASLRPRPAPRARG